MEKITSFTIDHIRLQPGLYVSRKDAVGSETVTTFDLRLTSPNDEPVMNTAEVHTIEHLAATFLRNDPAWKDRVLYFGPMGCRTGFYLLLAGDLEPRDVEELVQAMFRFIRDYEGPVPGAAVRRPELPGRAAPGDRLLPLHPGLPGGGPRGQPQRLRQLPGHESLHGQLLGQALYRPAGKHHA